MQPSVKITFWKDIGIQGTCCVLLTWPNGKIYTVVGLNYSLPMNVWLLSTLNLFGEGAFFKLSVPLIYPGVGTDWLIHLLKVLAWCIIFTFYLLAAMEINKTLPTVSKFQVIHNYIHFTLQKMNRRIPSLILIRESGIHRGCNKFFGGHDSWH